MAASFIDKARIFCRAGKGGNGAVAFHREKYVSAGGPDGGDGGNGGNIVLVVDDNMSTLMDFRYKRKYVAETGMDGQGARKYGKQGKDLTIRVPRGTVVRDAESNEIIKDMSDSEPFILCRGGKGGWGNAHFATPTRQAPRFAKSGLEGEEHDVVLELKLLADVGLIGFPNVGKSTLMNLIAKSEVFAENKLFATLDTTVRKVVFDNLPFLLSDTVGFIRKLPTELIESFKSTLDEVREADLLVHVVDISHPQFEDQIAVVKQTLQEIGAGDKPVYLVFNKVDTYTYIEKEEDDLTPATRENLSLEELKKSWIARANTPCIFLSALAKTNLEKFRSDLYGMVREIHAGRYPFNNFLY